MYEITPVHEFPGTTHTRAREIIENFQPRLHRVIIRSFVDAPTEYIFHGLHTIAVKVIDIFGNDTMTLVPITVG